MSGAVGGMKKELGRPRMMGYFQQIVALANLIYTRRLSVEAIQQVNSPQWNGRVYCRRPIREYAPIPLVVYPRESIVIGQEVTASFWPQLDLCVAGQDVRMPLRKVDSKYVVIQDVISSLREKLGKR